MQLEKNKDVEETVGLGDRGVWWYCSTVPNQLLRWGEPNLEMEGSTDSKISVILSIST